MKAVAINGTTYDGLWLGEAGDPVPAMDEVLIGVRAAGVNRADILQRQGHYPPPSGVSEILGLEVAGIVASDAAGWRAGDRVCALLAGGGYASLAVAPAGQLLPLPDDMRFEDAAALPEALATVHYNLIMQAGLKPGETLLVHGGGSGIGTMAIQVAKALGARVACTAGSGAKLAAAQHLGADILINYREEGFAERMRSEGGADVILDIIGAKYLPANVQSLRTGGRIVVIGMQGGRKGELDLARLLSKQGRIHATSLRALSVEDKRAVIDGVRERWWPLVCAGKISAIVDRALPIEQAGEAHRLLEQGQVTGKVVLAIA